MEEYSAQDVITQAYENLFDEDGNFLEQREISHLLGYKRWQTGAFHFNEKLIFPEVKENSDSDYEEDESELTPILSEAFYSIRFPNPKGGEGKKNLVLELDYLYRPVRIKME